MSISLYEYKKTVDDPMKAQVIETLYLEEPLFGMLPVEFIPGLTLPYSTEKALPGVAFRKFNEALPTGTGIVQRKVEILKPFGVDSDVEKDIADNYPSERPKKDRMSIKAMGIKYIQSLLYGNSPGSRAGAAYADVDGIDGIQIRLSTTDSVLMTGPNIVDNGAATGSDISSVFCIRFGDEYFQALMTTKGIDPRNLGELQTKPAYRTRFDADGGMAIYHGRAVSILKDINVSVPIDIDKLEEAIDMVAGDPSVLLMSKRTKRQLRKAARTLGLTFGRTLSEVGLPLETWGNIPIISSDAVIDTETVS